MQLQCHWLHQSADNNWALTQGLVSNVRGTGGGKKWREAKRPPGHFPEPEGSWKCFSQHGQPKKCKFFDASAGLPLGHRLEAWVQTQSF